MAKNYWLLKSEPSVFSLSDLENSPKRTTCWDGVRNYQVRNFLRDDVKIGDLAFFYHSGCDEPAVAGIVRVVADAYPDHTAFDPEEKHYDAASEPANPRWFMVDVRFERALKRPLTLQELKLYKDKQLAGLTLLQRGNRLSVLPVSKNHWEFIISLERQKHAD